MILFICVTILPLLLLTILVYVLIEIEDRKYIEYAEKSLKRKLSFFEERMIRWNLAGRRNQIAKCIKNKIPFSFSLPTKLDKFVKNFNKKNNIRR